MAVGSGELGTLHEVAGVRMAAVSAGIKKAGRLDVVLFELAPGAVTAGVFTLNAFCAAPVTLCKQHLASSQPRYLLVNTGNANAGTGEPGMQAARACCAALAQQGGVSEAEVLPFSTGVIGELLPAAKVTAVLPEALRALQANDWHTVARGIMTTDTRPKAASRQLQLGGRTVTITGIAKGAGMIKPNMATMLGYVFTDAAMSHASVQAAVQQSADKSFNRITIDGDTSTNDSCMLVATGKSGVNIDALGAPEQQQFKSALAAVFIELATAIVRDGEGATKFVTIAVEGGASVHECLQVGYAIGESPLVKTALFASDPNWGRILAAVGRAGLATLQLDTIEIWLDDVRIVSAGARDSAYTEEKGQAVLSKEEFTITVKLGRGSVNETLWTCDFSHDYVTINAEYRT
ncbi:MAG TPA: bifunctional glutamate N-acetyltransferase/amino-acid acetyltransferase ArgJ [Pseudomonadales bacterium]